MSEDVFDPYHVWLGIPADEQPPNHYRLLGVTVFEDSCVVIENAADRQMAHLRSVAAGPNAALAQRLLNEVSRARLCLLDAKRKSEYDASVTSSVAHVSIATESPSALQERLRRSLLNNKRKVLVIVSSGVAGILLLLLILHVIDPKDPQTEVSGSQWKTVEGKNQNWQTREMPVKSSTLAASAHRGDQTKDTKVAVERATPRLQTRPEPTNVLDKSKPLVADGPVQAPQVNIASLLETERERQQRLVNETVQQLKSDGRKARSAAIARISNEKLGEEARSSWVTALNDIIQTSPDATVREDAASALGVVVRTKKSLPASLALARALSDESVNVRSAAIGALGKSADKELAIPLLAKQIKSADSEAIRSAAAAAIVELDATAAVKLLVECADPSRQTARRIWAIKVLGTVRSESSVVSVLCKYIFDEAPDVQREALDALAELDGDAQAALPQLAELYSTAASNLQEHVSATMLAVCNSASVVSYVDTLQSAAESSQRQMAARSLREIGSLSAAAAVPALIGALSDASPNVQQESIITLAHFGPLGTISVPHLAGLVETTANDDIRGMAVKALIEIAPKSDETKQILREALVGGTGTRVRRTKETHVNTKRVWACGALAYLGPNAEWAVPLLTQTMGVMARDLDEASSLVVFLAAAEAAGKINQRDPRLLRLLRDFCDGKYLNSKDKKTLERARSAANIAMKRIEATR